MIVLFWACTTLPEGTYQPVTFPDPQILDFNAVCDAEQDSWLFTVATSAWTGNGLVWTRNPQGFEEEHPLISTGAQADGSADFLEIELTIVGDWRDAQRGKSTRWSCSDQETLSMLVEIYHPKRRTATDCLYVGEPWPEDEAPTQCDQLWEVE